MANLDNVVGILRAAGVTVHETPGWITTGYAGQDLIQIRGVLYHHTATNRLQFAGNAAPTVGMCKNGRPDLPPPLCNMVLDRNGEVWMIATGVANHAGRGSAPGIPTDMGNHYLIGIEMESSGIAPWDWTPAQLKMAPVVGAALEKAYLQGLPPEMRLQLGHKEYSSEGKIDPSGWPGDMDGLRASINAVLNGSAAIAPQGTIINKLEEIVATLNDAEKTKLMDAVDRILNYVKAPIDAVPAKTVEALLAERVPRKGGTQTGTTSLGDVLSYSDANLDKVKAK